MKPFTPPPKDTDDKAESESAYLGQNRDLDREAAVADHNRSQGIKRHVYWGTVAIIWAVMLAALGGVVALSWHMLAPGGCRWLSEPELGNLRTLLGVFLVSGLLADNARRLLSK